MDTTAKENAPNELDALLQTLRTEGAQRRDAIRWIQLAAAGVFAILLVLCIVSFSRGKSPDIADLVIYGSLLFGSCAYGLSPRLRDAVTLAATTSDKRLLGSIIEALDCGDPSLKETLENASIRPLTSVTPSDNGLLEEYQLDRLVKAVRLSNKDGFCIPAIRALGAIGTNRTLQNLDVVLNDPFIPQRRMKKLTPHIHAAMAELRIRLARQRLASGDAASGYSVQPVLPNQEQEKPDSLISSVG